MRSKVRLIAFMIPTVFFLLAHPAMADEVYLKNGDLITGTLETSEDGLLVVKTTYAEKIEAKWEEIVCINSDKEVTLLLKNNERKLYCNYMDLLQFFLISPLFLMLFQMQV